MVDVGASKKSCVTPAATESAVSEPKDSENDISDFSDPEMMDIITPYQFNFIAKKIFADLKL